jgi:xanthine dehydrogenase YagS FAD-binding subunit
MTPFTLHRALDAADAVGNFTEIVSHARPAFHAGGTTLVDLMKLDVVRPSHLIDLFALKASNGAIVVNEDGARIGAFATLSELAASEAVRARWPLIARALEQAASPQIRNVATVGGALLQRTRCSYFREVSSACNKREPGAGCAAIGGETRELAILGTSPHCIANHPGDLAVALVALDASVVVQSSDGRERRLLVADVYRMPSDRADLDTVLNAGELITEILLPATPWNASTYLKMRDREAYAFGLVTVAAAASFRDGALDDIRIVLGAVAPKPWRCEAAEAALRGRAMSESVVEAASALCVQGAVVDEQRAFKVGLAQRAVVRAVLSLDDRRRNG